MGQYTFTVIRNTAANYVSLLWRMFAAIFLVRFLFIGLGSENYGFWTLLWVVFGYSLMLDFGFGQTIQKITAETVIDHDLTRLNRIFSSIVAVYALMGVLILLGTLAIAPVLQKIFTFTAASPEQLAYLRSVFILFGTGAALVFPTGIFPEILAGLKRYDIKNYALLFNITLQLVGIYLLLKCGFSLMALAVFCALLNLTTNFIMAVGVYRLLPGFHLSFRLIKYQAFQEISAFSTFAYLLNLSRLMMGRCDKIVLGIILGMNAVSVYQIGTRLSELMEKLTTQFQDTLGSMAASYYKQNNWEALKWVMLKSGKVTAFITCGAVMILFLLAPPILQIWLKVQGGSTVFITRVALLILGFNILFRSAPEKLLLMSGQHKKIATVALVESLVCLGLSIPLVYVFGVRGIVWAPLLPTLVITFFVTLPLLSQEFHLPLFFYLRHVFMPLPLMLLPPIVVLLAMTHWLPPTRWNLWWLGMAAATGGTFYTLLGFRCYLSTAERKQVLTRIRQKFMRRQPASKAPSPEDN